MKTLFLFAALVITVPVLSQPGSLDKTFGNNGIATVESGNISFINSPGMVIQPDGKILQVATTGIKNGTQEDLYLVLARYNTNGMPDLHFNKKGHTIAGYKNASTFGTALALLPNGKILVAGHAGIANADPLLVLFNKDGTIDSSFGDKGFVAIDVTGDRDQALSIAIQNDNKIVVAGKAAIAYRAVEFLLFRYTAEGKLDKSFGDNGKVILSNGWAMEADVKLLPDGKVLLSGITSDEDRDQNLVMARYFNNGSPDNSFGKNGNVYIALKNKKNAPFSVTLQDDGKILAAGSHTTDTGSTGFLMRFHKNGSPDNSFGTRGKVTASMSGKDAFNDAVIQMDKKIIVTGTSLQKGRKGFLLMRYTANGQLDKSFGANGRVITTIGNRDAEAFSVRLYNDKIIAGGYTREEARHLAVARYNNSRDKKQSKKGK